MYDKYRNIIRKWVNGVRH